MNSCRGRAVDRVNSFGKYDLVAVRVTDDGRFYEVTATRRPACDVLVAQFGQPVFKVVFAQCHRREPGAGFVLEYLYPAAAAEFPIGESGHWLGVGGSAENSLVPANSPVSYTHLRAHETD